MQEVWKDIKGFEGLYQISNFGNVKSLNWGHRGYAMNLTPKKQNQGYLFVELIKNKRRKAFLIHRLVAIAFIQNPSNYPFVNHKDENQKNNFVENLEWCTESYNAKYSLSRHPDRKAKMNLARGEYVKKNRNCNPRTPSKRTRPIEQCDLKGNAIKRWDSIIQVKHELQYSDWSIAECCRGNRKKAYGYGWRYATENISSRETA